jgi:hypothetical protein
MIQSSLFWSQAATNFFQSVKGGLSARQLFRKLTAKTKGLMLNQFPVLV